jgi:hypothetical protein
MKYMQEQNNYGRASNCCNETTPALAMSMDPMLQLGRARGMQGRRWSGQGNRVYQAAILVILTTIKMEKALYLFS